ncbi:MAG: hypothetical protein HQM10_03920 [Candidatus Riflebacteria bacterium]|nr:hypothetical protein [Candidatus Riflebacteria bacterium]
MKYTPGQIKSKLRGYAEARKADRHNLAWAVANLMNATGNFKNIISVSQLLGEEPDKQKKTGEELKRDHEELKAKFERFINGKR